MSHDLLWHEVRQGRPTVCMECGQFFELVYDKEKVDRVLGFREEQAKRVGADTSKGMQVLEIRYHLTRSTFFCLNSAHHH